MKGRKTRIIISALLFVVIIPMLVTFTAERRWDVYILPVVIVICLISLFAIAAKGK